MCTQYLFKVVSELEEQCGKLYQSDYLDFLEEKLKKQLVTDGKVFPGSLAPVIARNQYGKQQMFGMVFGYAGPGMKYPKTVNARIETAARKPMFADSWMQRRCIAPAVFYYEWHHPETTDKTIQYAFYSNNADVLYLCGLYRIIEGIPQFVILTRDAPDDISWIHDRMPVMIPGSMVSKWIGPDCRPEDILPYMISDVDYEPE